MSNWGQTPHGRRRVLAPLGRRRVEVVERCAYGPYVVLHTLDPDGPQPQPGQFYMLAAAERWGGGAGERPFLPRAFSFLRSTPEGERHFLFDDVGPGTHRLGELGAGDEVWLAGPFGTGFAAPPEGHRALLAGGGVGIAPLAAWQDELGLAARVMLGFRDRAHAEGAAVVGGAELATDDGSVGHHGLVTELLAGALDDGDGPATVYACGPPPMLEAVRALCAVRSVPGQLALEAGMACGYGACYGCVVPTKQGYVRLCVDGPVLDAAALEVVR